jgi:hypothetical protein
LTNKNIVFFQSLTLTELELKFRVLIRASKPVFSGSLDHRVNLLDIVKIQKFLILPEREQESSADELMLMKKLVDLDR